jgi:hypothetical protein
MLQSFLFKIKDHRRRQGRKRQVSKLRISGGEPTLGKEHLLSVLDCVAVRRGRGFTFILETNGIPLGYDPDYAQALAKYRDIHVRVSLKAGSAAGFEARTGARGEYWEIPFHAIERLTPAPTVGAVWQPASAFMWRPIDRSRSRYSVDRGIRTAADLHGLGVFDTSCRTALGRMAIFGSGTSPSDTAGSSQSSALGETPEPKRTCGGSSTDCR